MPSQRFQFTLSGHSNWVRACQFSPDGRLAVSGGDDKTVRVWDIPTRQCIRIYDDHSGHVNTVAFHPDGTCIASGGTDDAIKVHSEHELLGQEQLLRSSMDGPVAGWAALLARAVPRVLCTGGMHHLRGHRQCVQAPNQSAAAQGAASSIQDLRCPRGRCPSADVMVAR